MVLDRKTKMARIGEAHRQWEIAWADMEQELYDPAKDTPGSDYAMHVLDVEATPEMNDDLQRRIDEALAAP